MDYMGVAGFSSSNAGYRMKVCSVDEMRRIDSEAPKYGLDHLLLMEDAGSAIYSVALEILGSVIGKKILVVAGSGNNGGDALVAARRLHAAGAIVRIAFVGDPGRASDLTRRNLEMILNMGIEVNYVREQGDISSLEKMLGWCEACIVGLIGIGLRGDVRGIYRDVIEAINRSGKVVISVDIPSGIDGDNGAVRGVAIRSTATVAMGLPKFGNILYPGYHYCGRLYISHLSYPRKLLEEVSAELNTPIPLPERVRWGHKGVFGKFLAIAGSRYYYGAPYYTSYSFLKAGGGYSRLAAPRSVIPYIAARCSEVVYIPLEETGEGSIAMSSYEAILRLIEEAGIDIVALGPGVSLNGETQELVRMLAEAIDRPLIIDGDGITAISKDPDRVKRRKAPTIITPHVVEFSRLVGADLKEIQEDPVNSLRSACRDLGVYIVLKGAHTMICYPDGYIYINMTGNPGMAKAGSGDVLTGAIAAMYGVGYRDPGAAARTGVLIHGLAGDLAAKDLGEDGVTPDDILNYLPRAVRILREDPGYIVEKYLPRVV